MQLTPYTVYSPRVTRTYSLTVAADLHGCDGQDVLCHLQESVPDAILIPGDLMEDSDLFDSHARGYAFLAACAAIAPTYYSLGNHEVGCYHRGNHFAKPTQKEIPHDLAERVAATGAVLLDNSAITVGEISFCGLRSGLNGKRNVPDAEAVRQISSLPGARVVLSHHPEYFVPYLRDAGADLVVSGHAHGGQWRVFGRGVFAPGQGLFPKYTSGVIDGICVISRGLGNHTRIPRLLNPTELVTVRLQPSP